MLTNRDNQRVSIITPLYNSGKTIGKTIESVLSSTYQDFEMIIVDDCSTDNGCEIVRDYACKDARIKLYQNENNLGACETRNKAIAFSEGRYIAFLDSDDTWDKDKLDRQLEYMSEEKLGLCYSACDCIDENDVVIKTKRPVLEKATYKNLLRGNYIPCLTVIIDTCKVNDIEELYMPKVGHEDYALWLRLLRGGIKAGGINEVLAHYRISQSSLSANKLKAMKWTFNIYRNVEGLGLIKSCYLFVCYAIKGVIKHS